jgi:hypothetical protein
VFLYIPFVYVPIGFHTHMFIRVYIMYVCVYRYLILCNAEMLLLFYYIGKSVARICLPVRGAPSLEDRRFSQALE